MSVNAFDTAASSQFANGAQLGQFPARADLENGFSDSKYDGHRPEIALALFKSEVPTSELFDNARRRVDEVDAVKETFVPIFLTNYCHADCAMCGMRVSNDEMTRKFAGRRLVEEQLQILHRAENVRGVGFLTGEYADKFTRLANAFYVGWAINRAFQIGFEKIFFNIGSLEPDELEVLTDWIEPGDPRVTMCVFQETYDRDRYNRIMGRNGVGSPKADYDRRIRTFDNWLDAGFKTVNPGFLVGLHNVEIELVKALRHLDHLSSRGANIYMSLPRLRPALGLSNTTKVGDDDYLRVIAVIALLYPAAGMVITTREDMAFQDKALPLIRTVSPGSPDVAPYRWDGEADNEIGSSQFMIPDHRRPRDILSRIAQSGYEVRYFDRMAQHDLAEVRP